MKTTQKQQHETTRPPTQTFARNRPRRLAGGAEQWAEQAEYWAGYWHRQRDTVEDVQRREVAETLGLLPKTKRSMVSLLI